MICSKLYYLNIHLHYSKNSTINEKGGAFYMMESAEMFIDKSYKELLAIRKKLLEDIYAYETCVPVLDGYKTSEQNAYLCNLESLGKVCELIWEKFILNPNNEIRYIDVIRMYLNHKGINCNTNLLARVKERKEGKEFTLEDHIRGMVYSMMSSQKKWFVIEPNLSEIDKLFFDYDYKKIIEKNPDYYCEKLYELKCGNRNTKKQMNSLKDNIKTFQRIENDYGSIDLFILSKSPEEIVKSLSDEKSLYKIKCFGEALSWEYLRNIGIDAAKPDVHLRRFFSAKRMGTGKVPEATEAEVIEQINFLSEETGISKTELDNLIWRYCADGYGEICTANPRCNECLIRHRCNKGRVL